MDFDKYQNKLAYVSKRENAVGYEAWQNENSLIHQQFQKDLFEELGVTDNPKADLLFCKAWDQGHSGGFSEVYNVALDLVDLIV